MSAVRLDRYKREKLDDEKYSNRLVNFFLKNFISNLLDLINETGERAILDVGCGEGHIIAHLLKRRDDLDIDGLDIDGNLLKVARQINPSLKFLVDDLYRSSLRDDAYPLTLCIEVLEHLERPGDAIVEIRRITRNYCIMSVPNEPFFRLSNLIRGRYLLRLGNKPRHLHAWSDGEFLRLISAHLTIVKVVWPFPWVMALCKK